MVAYATDTSNVVLGDVPDHWKGLAVTRGLFEALRVQPALGRALNEDDFVVGKDRVLILSDALWRGVFGADPGALGRGIQMDGNLYTIVGVVARLPHRA